MGATVKKVFRLLIAGLYVDIIRENPILARDISKYVRSDSDRPADIVIDIDDEYIKKEIKDERRLGIEFDAHHSEYLAIYRCLCERMIDFDGFLMHASVLEKDGVAYAFTAPSGTGKSTHARLWRENINGVRMVNDDKPIIRIIDGIPHACGTPWCGKHGLSENITIPLRGICFLEQASENKIVRRMPADEMHKFLSQIYRPIDKELLIKTLDLADMVLRDVPIWRMGCNMEPAAAEMSYSTMSEQANN